jgi:hypothetical protein
MGHPDVDSFKFGARLEGSAGMQDGGKDDHGHEGSGFLPKVDSRAKID